MMKSLRNKYLLSAIVITLFMVIAFSSSGSDEQTEDTAVSMDSVIEDQSIEILSHSATYDSLTHSYTISCSVKNTSDKPITHAEITSTCYDREDHSIGTGPGNIKNLPAGAETTIEMHVLGIQDSAVTHTVEVGKVIFDTPAN